METGHYVSVCESTALALSAAAGEGMELILSGPWGYVTALVLGAVTGSFLNVVIVRLPAGLSIVRPGSHCMRCNKPVAWYDNIPIASYLILRGKCRHCRSSFSATYMLIELLTAALSVAVFYHAFWARGLDDPYIALAHYVAELIFVSVLIVIAFIDLRTWIIPNVITYPSVLVFFGVSVVLRRLLWWEALAGAVAGYGVLALIIWGYQRITGREGMGWGDAKLLAAVGAFLGWQNLPAVVFLGAVQGLLAAAVCIALGKSMAPTQTYVGLEDDEEDSEDAEGEPEEDKQESDGSVRHVPVPFGPFLALGALETLFFGAGIVKIWIPN